MYKTKSSSTTRTITPLRRAGIRRTGVSLSLPEPSKALARSLTLRANMRRARRGQLN